ncbi:MAG: asparagine synthase, partial [Candidatus Obscuribacterales bacterium]|nr:asparagine synthase [Candidatus Obscuribacterales bacterium]
MAAISGFYSFNEQADLCTKLRKDSKLTFVEGQNFAVGYASQYARLIQSDSLGAVLQVSVSGEEGVWDLQVKLREGGFTLSRDIFGRISLYWLRTANAICFSTHLKSLLQFVDSLSISTEAFHAYSSFSFVPAPLSAISGINSIEPGCSLRWGEHNSEPEFVRDSNWLLNQNVNSSLSEAEAIDGLVHELDEAIKAQVCDLRDRSVAVFLSGGLDSAITAAALTRVGVKIEAYSLDFGPYGISELPYAQEVAQHLKIPLKIVSALPRDIERNFHSSIEALDGNYGDGVTVPLYLLNKAAAADGHTLAFNGEGGDQLFGGWTNKPLIASSVYGEVHRDDDSFLSTYMRTFHRLNGHERLVFSDELYSKIVDDDLGKYLAEALSRREDAPLINVLRRANLLLKGAQNIQPRASNLAMYQGLNLRSLFCHKPLADWTFSIPPELMLRGACEKYILKKAVESWLPESIVFREKRGMGVPLSDWCTGPMWGHLGKYFNSAALARSGYWQTDIAARLVFSEVSAQLTGRRIGETLWLMLMWEAWLDLVNGAERTTSRYNLFWPPLTLLKLFRKEVYQV